MTDGTPASNKALFPIVAITIAAHALIFLATALMIRAMGRDFGAVHWSLELYFDYASRAVAGDVPYRDFVCEYPLLTFPLFLIPRLLTADLVRYKVLFALQMLAFDAWAILLIASHVARSEGPSVVRPRLGWYTLYCLSLGCLLFGRFELAPMALCFASAHWWFSGRATLGGLAAGLGALVKVFPGLVGGPALLWEASRIRDSRMRGTTALILTCAIGTATWFLVGGARVRESIVYQTGRGLEVESIYAGALLLVGRLRGINIPWVLDHKSCHIVPEWGDSLAALTLPVQGLALLLVLWRFRRTGMRDPVRFAGAAVLAFTITGKVLSPQFLIWIFPFPVVIRGRAGGLIRRLFLLCCVSTAVIYPGDGFGQILTHQTQALVLLNLRNLLLVWLLGLFLWMDGPGADAAGAPESDGGPTGLLACITRRETTPRDRGDARPALRRWLWAGLIGFGAVYCGPVYLSSMRPARGVVKDFFQEWASARNYLNGLPVYTSHTDTIPRYLGLAAEKDLYVDVNAHPPTSVLLAVPFAALGYRDAVLAWNLLSLGMLAVSLWLVGSGLKIPFSAQSLLPLAAGLLLCNPLLMQIHFGQFNLLLLLLVVGAWVADRSGRPLTAGALLGTATAIKLFPGFMLLYFVLKREWRAVIAGAATLAILTGLTAGLLGLEAYRDYVCNVVPKVAEFRSAWPNASLAGFWTKLFDPAVREHIVPLRRSAAAARIGAACSCMVIVASLVWAIRRAKTRAERDHAYALTMIAMLLVSPITWDHYLLLLLLPVASIWVRLPGSMVDRAMFVVSLIGVMIWPSVIYQVLIPGGRDHGVALPLHTLTVLSIQCYALLILYFLGLKTSRIATGRDDEGDEIGSA